MSDLTLPVVDYPAAAHAQSGVKQSGPSVCLSVCQQKNIEMCPKCTMYGFSCLQRACGQRKSYLLYVHNASGRSIRLYSLPFKPLHIYRIYREPLTHSSYYVTMYGTRRICVCAYEMYSPNTLVTFVAHVCTRHNVYCVWIYETPRGTYSPNTLVCDSSLSFILVVYSRCDGT